MFILINNILWKIKWVNGQNKNLVTDSGVLTLGMTDNLNKTIYISVDLDYDMMYNVLCHELVHAFCFSYGYKLNKQSEETMAQFITSHGKDIYFNTDAILKYDLAKMQKSLHY